MPPNVVATRQDTPPRVAKQLPPVTGALTPAQPAQPDVVGRTAPRLTVASYNILAAKRGLEGIIDTLQDLGADLIALQEVDRNTRRFGRVDQPKRLAQALGYEVAFSRHRKYQGGEIGVALLSRFPILDVRRIAVPGHPLAMLLASVQVGYVVVRVLVVHLLPTDPRDPPARRRRHDRARQAQAKHALKTALAEPGPTVVMGDFNARASGPEYAMFGAAMTDACPAGAATWPTPISLIRIDYVWTAGGLRAEACPRTSSSASDHRPVVAALRLPRATVAGDPD